VTYKALTAFSLVRLSRHEPYKAQGYFLKKKNQKRLYLFGLIKYINVTVVIITSNYGTRSMSYESMTNNIFPKFVGSE